MQKSNILLVVLVIVACFLRADGRAADKYSDENRPYEFGFNIERDGEKEQHRHEKKGEDGLIEGEFGFITADGVYHVTVYATDENGNFKILSMKNIRVKPYPTTATADRKAKAPAIPSSGNKPIVEGPSVGQPVQSCSHCSIPTTTKEPALTDIASVSRDNPAYNQPQYPEQPQYAEQPQYPPENYPEQPHQQYPQEQNPQEQYPQEQYPQEQYPQEQYPQEQYPQEQYPQEPNPQQPQYPAQPLPSGERNPKQYDVPSQYPPEQGPSRPTLISAEMKIVDPNTDINALAPGEQPGLPNGLDKGDMQLLLYTFNYTVGFHGHFEEGYTNGYKKGYYFVTGRNGVRTRVDYEADDKGFRPKISQEVLDLISEDVPKEETEKDAKYGLKGYEFKWLYYPSDSKRR